MSHAQFKNYLQRDKAFLKELFESNSVSKSKNLLSFASDSELVTLIKYTHFVATGEIKIKKKNFDGLGNRVFALIRKNFEKKSAVHKLSQSVRKDKIKILFKLVASFSDLLAPLFIE